MKNRKKGRGGGPARAEWRFFRFFRYGIWKLFATVLSFRPFGFTTCLSSPFLPVRGRVARVSTYLPCSRVVLADKRLKVQSAALRPPPLSSYCRFFLRHFLRAAAPVRGWKTSSTHARRRGNELVKR